MIAVECLKCGGTAYTANPVSLNPCPYCGTAAIDRSTRSLVELDRENVECGETDDAHWVS